MNSNSFVEIARADVWLNWFYDFRVIAPRVLSEDEISRVSGCIGYALRQVLAGEDLSLPEVHHTPVRTVLEYRYDATKTRRDDPCFDEAFGLAKRYVLEGSPVRTTNRAGTDTKGTRLVEGVPGLEIGIFVKLEDLLPN